MGCSNCILNGKSRVFNNVVKADIAIVGENPHIEEVKRGEVFVGQSGQVLNKALQLAGLNRREVAILNSFQCIIPKEQKTSANLTKICKSCREHIVADILAVAPKVIIPLGDTALYQITKIRGITKYLNRIISSQEFNCKVIPGYHPSYLLHQGLGDFTKMTYVEQSLIDCFMLAKKIVNNEETKIDTTNYVRGTEEHIEDLLSSRVVSFDAEFPNNKFLCGGFSNKEGTAYVFYPDETGIKAFKSILENPNIAKVVASRPADEHIVEQELGIKIKGTIYDVLTMAHVLDENYIKYSLEAIANVYTQLKNIKDTAEGMRLELDKATDDLVIRYNGTDCDATLRCYNAMKKIYGREPDLTRYYGKFIIPVQNALSDMTKQGVPIDLDQLRHVENELTKHLVANKVEALKCLPKEIKEIYKDNLSLSRSAIIADYLFLHEKGLKLTPEKFTPTTKLPSTDEEHLKAFSRYKFVKHLLEWKKVYKISNTYIKNLYQYYKDGYIYPSISLTTTVTGRTSMSRPSMQNFPKRGAYASILRSVIRAKDGDMLLEADLAQSELRIAGWIADDKNILKALKEGMDLHMKTASIITGKALKDVTKEDRQKAKAVNFGFLYGQSAEGFVEYAKNEYDIIFSLKEAQKIRDKFFSRPDGYYGLLDYHRKFITYARKYGYVEQPLGRRRRLTAINSEDSFLRGKAERQAINFPIQAFSSDLALIGLMLFNERFKRNNDAKVILFIHDAVIVRCREDKVDEVARDLKYCMETLSAEYIATNFKLNIGYPIVAEVKAGKSLNTMKEVL